MKNLCDFRPAVTKVPAHGHDHPRKLASTSFSADAKSVCALRLSFCSRDDDSLQEKLMKEKGLQSQVRVWQARYAGPEAGAVVVSVEYRVLAAFAADEAKVSSSSEYQNWLMGLDKIRKIVSDSLYGEL